MIPFAKFVGILSAVAGGSGGGGASGGGANTCCASARIVATGPVYLNVDKSGSDARGANGIQNPFLTVQKLIDYAAQRYDFAGFPLYIRVGEGTFTECLQIKPMFGAMSDPVTGDGAINIVGIGDIDQVILQADGNIASPALTAKNMSQLVSLDGVTLDGSQNDWVAILDAEAAMVQLRNLHFLCADNSFPVTTFASAIVNFAFNYTATLIAAGSGCNTFATAVGRSSVNFFSHLAIQGAFALTDAFLNANEDSLISWSPQSATGAATGGRAKADYFGKIINLAGVGQAGIPGNADGVINAAHGAQLVSN